MNTHSFPQPTRFSIAMLLALELALTSAAAFALFHLAEPMARPALALGLGRRYAESVQPGNVTPAESAAVPEPERARNLNRQAGPLLAGNALLGWLALWIARRYRPGASLICISLWFGGAMAFNPFGRPAWEYWAISALFAAAYLCYGIIYRCRSGGQSRTATGVFYSYWSAAGWPGWVLFTGIGVLFVTDFAARGPLTKVIPYAGIHQAEYLWAANIVLNLSAIWRGRLMIGLAAGMSQLSQLCMRLRGCVLLLTAAMAIASAVGWLGRSGGLNTPQLSSEIFRIIFAVAAAWSLYRCEWNFNPQSIWTEIKRMNLFFRPAIAFMVSIAFGSKVIADDNGPLLIMSLAAVLGLIPLLLHRVIVRRSRLLACLIIIVAELAGGWSWLYAVHNILPQVNQRAAQRETYIEDPYRAGSEYLAQINWLIDATPADGFGLGRVPWCGANALVGARTCNANSGSPLQMPSDYASAGLAAVWGVPGAALIILTLLFWLTAISKPGLTAWRAGRSPAWGLLQIELVGLFTFLAFAQTLITFAGSFGLIPLTGITLPCLGYGGMALVFSAIWIGLALNPA